MEREGDKERERLSEKKKRGKRVANCKGGWANTESVQKAMGLLQVMNWKAVKPVTVGCTGQHWFNTVSQ